MKKLVLAALMLGFPALAAEETLALQPGAQKLIKFAGVDRVAIGDPAVADVRVVDDGELLVTAVAAGKTTLTAHAGAKKQSWTVEVAPPGDAKPAGGGNPLELTIGAERLVKVKDFEGLAVVDPEIAEARTLNDTTIVIRGVSPGSTVITVYSKGGKKVEHAVTVAAPDGVKVYKVVLMAAGPSKINVIKEVRDATGLGLKEAKDLVDGAPRPVKEFVIKDDADKLKATLERAGATVEVK